MENIIKIGLFWIGICSVGVSIGNAQQYGLNEEGSSTVLASQAEEKPYVAKSGGFPSMDFIKRFGKHCTTHKNLVGRQVSGLCDDVNLCTSPEQYKACYQHCIKNRSKEDEKTTYIFTKLASCKINASDAEMVAIFNQANLRLSPLKKSNINSKSFTMPTDKYQAERTSGIQSFKSINPFSPNCTTHKNAFGVMTKGICDNGKQCTVANYKKCYNTCVLNRRVDDKTFYVLKNLRDCQFSFSDLEVGDIAKDVHKKYLNYEVSNGRELLKGMK